MKLYEINEQLNNLLENGFDTDCIDMETGEILEDKVQAKIAELAIDEAVKLESIALYIKNLIAESKALKDEETALNARRKAKENKTESLKNYLSNYMLETQKTSFETSKCKLSFRKSESLKILDESKLIDELAIKQGQCFLKFKTEIDKAGIKTAIKEGKQFLFADISVNQNLQVK